MDEIKSVHCNLFHLTFCSTFSALELFSALFLNLEFNFLWPLSNSLTTSDLPTNFTNLVYNLVFIYIFNQPGSTQNFPSAWKQTIIIITIIIIIINIIFKENIELVQCISLRSLVILRLRGQQLELGSPSIPISPTSGNLLVKFQDVTSQVFNIIPPTSSWSPSKPFATRKSIH